MTESHGDEQLNVQVFTNAQIVRAQSHCPGWLQQAEIGYDGDMVGRFLVVCATFSLTVACGEQGDGAATETAGDTSGAELDPESDDTLVGDGDDVGGGPSDASTGDTGDGGEEGAEATSGDTPSSAAGTDGDASATDSDGVSSGDATTIPSDSEDTGGEGCGLAFDSSDAESERGYWVIRRSMTIAGVERNYLLSVPENYDEDRAYPLVFGFHGSGGDREQLRRYMNVERPAESAAVFVYPEGLEVNSGGTGWDLDRESDDLTFVDELYSELRSQLCLDDGRVFATGHSFGGCMSNAVGCFRGDMFRAIAPIAGCGPFRGGPCEGQVAALMIHSPKDTATNYSGAISGCTTWMRANSCEESPDCGCHWVDELGDAKACEQTAQQPYETSVTIETSDRDDADPILRAYQGCDEGYPLVFADHWRRERQDPDDPGERWHNPPPWSPALIWEFFAKF